MPHEMTSPAEALPATVAEEGNSESDNTVINDETGPRAEPAYRQPSRTQDPLFLNVDLDDDNGSQYAQSKSPSEAREQRTRLDDALRFAQIERQLSNKLATLDERDEPSLEPSRTRGSGRDRYDPNEEIDDFDIATNPLHERKEIWRAPEAPKTWISKLLKRISELPIVLKWFFYIVPGVVILAIPLIVGAAAKRQANVGGVQLYWFAIWLEIVWLTLWAGRLIAKALPYPAGLIASIFTNNSKKWRDLVKQLEVAATLFFWWLAIEISFLPTMINHQFGGTGVQNWQNQMNKVLVAFLVAATLNFVEKLLIQLIAISFHQRTYEDRIDLNKFQIESLLKLYTHSKEKLDKDDSEFATPDNAAGPSGARTPAVLEMAQKVQKKAQQGTKAAFAGIGDMAGKAAGDFTGRAVKYSSHPSQMILTLLSTTTGSQLLARRLYRTFSSEVPEREKIDLQQEDGPSDSMPTITKENLVAAFENDEQCESAFNMLDKDMNGDISMEEFEAVCVEIGRERKAITASLKDLDSVISKLDNVFMFVVVAIAILVLIALISSQAAAGLTNAGSVVLGLSWLFSATASEFLQSLIFVFYKHPFDVGDRVTIYGNTGSTYHGDDYFVKEIALLYTEFKKMEGHIVQAPNSYLNTLFILNMRRSAGLAEAVPMIFKFGTTIEQIEMLQKKLQEFVAAERREYQPNILTEMRDVTEVHTISLNIIFFYKSNWQNELLRLQRRNKFMCALMTAIQECGIEGPRMRYPGQKDSFPIYMQHIPADPLMRGRGGEPDYPAGRPAEPSSIPTMDGAHPSSPHAARRPSTVVGDRDSSIAARSTGPRHRSETISQKAKRQDFSLGVQGLASGDMAGDLFDNVSRSRVPPINVRSPSRTAASRERTSMDPGLRVRASHDAERPTARTNSFSLRRSATEFPHSTTSVHRNRFFPGRHHEAQRSSELERMESGMAGIPEVDSGANTAQHMDPRTGLVSPRAMRLNTNDDH